MVDAKIVEECYLVTWVDEVRKMLAEHLLWAQPDKLLDVFAGKDHLPARPDHQAEAVEAGEKVEGSKKMILFLFFFVLCCRRLPLQLWVWCIGQNFIYQSLIGRRGIQNKIAQVEGTSKSTAGCKLTHRTIYLDLVYFTLMKILQLTVSYDVATF